MVSALVLFLLAAGCGEYRNPVAGDGPGLRLEVAYTFPGLEAGDFIRKFRFQRDGTLWAASFEGRLFEVDADGTTVHAVPGFGAGRLGGLFIDASDRVWIAFGDGYAMFHDGEWTRHDPPDLMTWDAAITDIAVNHAGDVLLVAGNAEGGGLLLRRGANWVALTPANSDLPSPITNAVAVADGGSFWTGSAAWQGKGGLSEIRGGRIERVFTRDSGLLYNWVDALALGNQRVYIGYAVPIYDDAGPDGGLQVLNLGDGTVSSWYPASSDLTSNRVRSLLRTTRGELWFTTALDGAGPACVHCFSGIGRLDDAGTFNVLSSLTDEDGVLEPNEYLPWIESGADGRVYVVAGEGRAIYRVEPGQPGQ